MHATFIPHSPVRGAPFLHNLDYTWECVEASVVGRTIPSWRMIVEVELGKLRRFREFLSVEDKAVFDDLLNQCRLYASYASTMASPFNETPRIISMLLAQHKRLIELEKKINCAPRRKN
jgi:hypothetical protein